MQSFNFKKMVLVAIVLVCIAAVIDYGRRHINTVDVKNIFAGIAQNLDGINHVTLQQGDKKLELKKNDNGSWALSNKNNYPANNAMVQKLLITMSDAKMIEAKTNNPALYTDVDIDEPSVKNKAMLVQLNADKKEWSYIFGKMIYLPRTYQYFVRPTNDTQSWAVTIATPIALDTPLWIDRTFLSIREDDIQSVIFYPTTHAVEVERVADGQHFQWVRGKISAPNVSADSIASSAAMLLSGNFLQDVGLDKTIEKLTPLFMVTTKDGLVITAANAGDIKKWRLSVVAKDNAAPAALARAALMQPIVDGLIVTVDQGVAPFLGMATQ